jgi:methyl-accepting chemotaxis protein
MSIKTKLIACIAILAFFIGGLIVSAFLITGSISSSLKTVVEDRLVPTKQLKTIADLYAVNIVDTAHKVRNGGLGWDQGETSIEDALATIDSLWSAYMATQMTDEEKVLTATFQGKKEQALPEIRKLLGILKAKDQKALDSFVVDQLYAVIDPLGGDVGALIELQIRVGNEEYAKSLEAQSLGNVILWAVSVSASLVTAFSLWIVMFGVSRPISAITGSMKALASGEIEKPIPFAGRTDEIGSMAVAVEFFRQTAIANKRMQDETDATRRQAEADRIAAQEKAEADAARKLREATAGLAAGLKRLASGDLAFQLDEAFSSEFEALRHDFNSSVRQLGDTLLAITDAVSSMDNGTREIASGANDLSRRTEQQAAALEETAAALDEITANVRSSETRTAEARGVARQANDSAAHSADIVTQAEAAMGRIETSSQQISNIIVVIDEIAFQTNLLALNAGVEAARAGEAGKGFAVVAQEVRELAQRSANAAKEIKGLIQNSTTEVTGGVRLVRETGTALKTICTFIGEINEHMQAIATATKEQATGLVEVNQAVNAMDQTTQQNAAMVEESTAASATLASEAERLRGLIDRFKIAGGGSAAEALRSTARAMARPSAETSAKLPQARPRMAPSSAASGNSAAAQSWEEF